MAQKKVSLGRQVLASPPSSSGSINVSWSESDEVQPDLSVPTTEQMGTDFQEPFPQPLVDPIPKRFKTSRFRSWWSALFPGATWVSSSYISADDLISICLSNSIDFGAFGVRAPVSYEFAYLGGCHELAVGFP